MTRLPASHGAATGRGRVYFVTELFPDGDLQTWLARNGPTERRQALILVAQVCEVPADAHAVHVIQARAPISALPWTTCPSYP